MNIQQLNAAAYLQIVNITKHGIITFIITTDE